MRKIRGFGTWLGPKILFYHRFRQDLPFRHNRRGLRYRRLQRGHSSEEYSPVEPKISPVASSLAPSDIVASLI